MVAQDVLPLAPWRLISMIWCLVIVDAASSILRKTDSSQLSQVSYDRIRGTVVPDEEPVVLDYSNVPFRDSIVALASDDPFKTNPKNGTPWFRYTKTAGRGKANHTHFGGLSATGDFPEDILHAHNVVRERAGVAPLQWNNGLHEMAQARVLKLANEGCYIKHSPLRERWYEKGFEYIGENLYKVINMKPTGVDIVDAWYAEIEDYTFGLVGDACVKDKCAGRAAPPCTLGHFTQVMWAKSTHVGCARAECPDQAKRTFVSVCNYGPGGNIVGHYPFPAVNSGKMGLSMNDCRMTPKPHQETVWEEVKEGKMPHLRSGAFAMAANVFVMASCALFALAACD